MGDVESAVSLYSKAVHLLVFLLVEAPSLILNPPFFLQTQTSIGFELTLISLIGKSPLKVSKDESS